MSVLFVLLLLAVGITIGGAGMRRVGRLTRHVTGPWRPGVGVLAMVVLVAAVALASRGAEIAAGGMVLLCLVLAVLARRRMTPPTTTQSSTTMGRSEAASILGVPTDASSEAIDAAYRRLMRRTHPDLGGTAGLAIQLNAAREAMLRR